MFTYNFEDLALINEERDEKGNFMFIEEVSYEDKKNFMESITNTSEIKKELADLIDAGNNGVIKKTKWVNDYNKVSLSSYIKKNCNNIKYGRFPGSYYDSSDCAYICVDTKTVKIVDSWDASRAIDSMNNYDSRFKDYLNEMYRREVKHKKELDEANYEVNNADRIEAGRKAYKLMETMDKTAAPYAIFEKENFRGHKEYEIQYSHCVDHWSGNYSRNGYGELTDYSGKKVISKEECDNISALVLKYGKKMSVLIDEYNEEIKKILGERK